VIVRPANTFDQPEILRMSRAMHAAGRYADVPLDEKRWMAFVQSAANSPYGCVLIAQENGKTLGMLVAGISAYPFSASLMASDVIVWTEPAARNGHAAAGLVERYEAHARDHGAIHAYLGTTQMQDFARVGRFYATLGYQKVGEVWRKDLA
jgi:GNAT superfamily N-acetyltransferase